MSKTLAPSNVVTNRDSKGVKFVSIVEAAYNKARLSQEEAQRVNDTPGLADLVTKFIAESRLTDKFADEEVRSNYSYPSDYKGPKPIGEQIAALVEILSLSPVDASQYVETVLPTLALPQEAEGWFAFPSVDAVANLHFPSTHDPLERYVRAVNLVLEKLAASRSFYNYRAGEVTASRLRRHVRTAQALEHVATQQKGDILVLASQFGMRHRGRSARRAREVFVPNEFGHGSFEVGCIALTHPERYVHSDELDTDCLGDEFAPAADGVFSWAPCFRFRDELEFGTFDVDRPYDRFGGVSFFLPQEEIGE